MNVEAIEYIMSNHKCICGNDIVENSMEWIKLEEWKQFLPPNNIGFEIEKFTSEIEHVSRKSEDFESDFIKARTDLITYIHEYDELVAELEILNSDIGSFDKDVHELKEREKSYNTKIIGLNIEYRENDRRANMAKERKESLLNEQERYKVQDEKVIKLNKYRTECEYLRNQIEHYCEKKEAEMRLSL